MSNPFAKKSDDYAKYRPVYPPEIFEFLNSLVTNRKRAWDCGTGNGQFATELAKSFNEVYATDISVEQILNATSAANIFYSAQPSEATNFPDKYFDIITIAQAIHWFNFEQFYTEVNRTLKPNGIIAATGYGLLRISDELNRDIDDFYSFTGPYWDPQRKFLDDQYKTIPFPFNEIKAPNFSFTVEWTLDHLIGFLNTWSAVKHFIKAECYNPVDEFFPAFKESWGDVEKRKVTFPLFMRVGRV